jgi:hypothetical protein
LACGPSPTPTRWTPRATLDSRDGRAVFGAICSQVTARDVTTSVATVTGPADVSYRRHLTGLSHRIQFAAYVYKDAVFDLNADRVEPVAELKTSAGIFRNLVRARFTIRNRRLGGISRFDATFAVEGALAGVPIQATYQPDWWFKIRLDLDDDFDVPAEPSGDDVLRQRVDELCARASDAPRETGDRPAPARR